MKTVNARITSKNQLTLPAALVRKYKLDVNRNVTITEKNGNLLIKPEPGLDEILKQLWAKTAAPSKKIISHEEFERISREAWGEKEL